MKIKKIHIINGPNLNLLGKRQTEIYGNKSFADYFIELSSKFDSIDLHYYQSNHEGDLLDKLHAVGFEIGVGVVLNAGGYTHTSIALGDAIAGIQTPVVEVHISDIEAREKFRAHSYIKPHAVHFIKGLGLSGYEEAITFLLDLE